MSKHVIFNSTPKNCEENLSYDVDSLFINVPVEEAINYFIAQIYPHNMLTPICSKIIDKTAAGCGFK